MPPTPPRRSLDRRLLLLPLVALSTAAAVLIPTELALRSRHSDQQIDRCLDEHVLPPHGRAGCVSRVKVPEGPWVENRYNQCGYRSPSACEPVPAGTLRVAIVGSSMGAGTFVPEPASLGGRLPALLRSACGQPVQTQNLAVPDFPVEQLAASTAEAARLKPDLILVTVTSFDVSKSPDSGAKRTKPLIKTVTDTLQTKLKDYATVYMAKELYLSNEREYLGFIAAQGQTDAALSALSRGGLATLADQVRRIARANYGIPVLLAFLPAREEVVRARLRAGHQDPVPAAMSRIAHENGLSFASGLDMLPPAVPTASLYYVANGHMNATGDGYLARGFAKIVAASLAACHPKRA